MKEKDKFRYAEKCLYDYKKNTACLKTLREDLRVVEADTSVHVQNYQYRFSFTGMPSNPVEARQIKLENLQNRIQRLERCTQPITDMIADLTSPSVREGSDNKALMEVLELLYFGGNIPDVVMSELKITRSTFFRRRRKLVYTAITYMAL